MTIAVLGAGMVGRTIAGDLAQSFRVIAFDRSADALAQLQAQYPKVETRVADLTDYDNYGILLEQADYVATAVPGFMGYRTLEAVIKAGKSVVDISFFPENALELDALAKEKGVTAIVDCGVAPGMSNLILGYHNARMTVTDFSCMVGGLPKQRVKPFEYKAPFSPIDVIEEYTRPARLMENGTIVTKPALSEPEFHVFDTVGTLESFNTDGLRSLLFTMGHIPNMKEKTLRYPGHAALIRDLIAAGFFSDTPIEVKGHLISPLEFSSRILLQQWKLRPAEEEFTLMRIEVKGHESGNPVQITYDLFDEYDRASQTSSMSRTTGYTCTAAMHLLINRQFTATGIFPPEFVGADEVCFRAIMDYLANRQVVYRKY
jgi:lysine 6-dehydrogenase